MSRSETVDRDEDLYEPRDEVDEVVSGRSSTTPAWSLLSVALAIGMLFAVAVALAALSYFLA